jgi:hypothetical protein
MSPFKYMFRRFLRNGIKDPTEAYPQLRALAATSIPIAMNIVVLVHFIAGYHGHSVLHVVGAGQVFVSLAVVLLAVSFIQYRMWVANGRWRSIADEDISESTTTYRICSSLILLYFLATILSAPVLGRIVYNLQR